MQATFLLLALIAGQEADTGNGGKEKPQLRLRERKLDYVLIWNEIALEAIRKDRTPPPRAARNLAILHVAIADAVNPIYQQHRPYRVNLRATDDIDPSVAAAAAARHVLADLYPRQVRTFDRELQRTIDVVKPGKPRDRGETLGKYVAARILTSRQDDGSDLPAHHKGSADIGIWRPTLPANAAGLLPRWGEVVCFGIKDRRTFRPDPPPALSSDEYTRDFDEVKKIGSRGSRKRTAEQSLIAWFWDDGPGTCTPPGHWNQIAQESALVKNLTPAENARLFALLNIAMADAGVLCWDCKYRHRLWRPVTAIRNAGRDGNPDTEPERDWLPLLDTPAFPSYTSGHSTFSGAAATVLEKYFETSQFEFTVGSDGFPGAQRTYNGFWEAARQAGKSRIYGGIHFECDNSAGLALGKAIGEEVFRTRLLREDASSRRESRSPANSSASRVRERP